MIRRSDRFLDAGQSILAVLDAMKKHVEIGDYAALADFYGEDFVGRSLSLNRFDVIDESDGLIRKGFVSQEASIGKQQAIDDWGNYLRDFEEIVEAKLEIDRLGRSASRGVWRASLRFELRGRLQESSSRCLDHAYLRARFRIADGKARIVGASLIEGTRSMGSHPHFVDASVQSGIDFRNSYYPGFLQKPLRFAMIRYGPGGIGAADYDSDGLYDLFIPDGVASRLLRNTGGGRFEDVTMAAGLAGLDGVSVGLFADIDNDGDKDLFVSRTFRPNQLFLNDGQGRFDDITQSSGIGADCCTTVASWADYDSDGDLDLYVGRYLDPRNTIPTTLYARNGEPNRLYRNDGHARFSDVTAQAQVGDPGLCLGSVFGDYDEDGDPDLYVVNDFGRNTLYRNEGNGTFADVTTDSGALAYGAGMNASMADYDNDDLLDIYVTNIRSQHAWIAEPETVWRYVGSSVAQGAWWGFLPVYREIFRQSGTDFVSVFQQMSSGNTLLRNRGDGSFQDTTWRAGANPSGWYWGASLADFDNDGDLDIYAANGWVYNESREDLEFDFLLSAISDHRSYRAGELFDPDRFANRSWHGWERNAYLRNNGDGTFSEAGYPAGADLILNSRGVAVADFENRGVWDIAVAASDDRHALLSNQVGLGRNWLAVELVGVRSNRDAVGARIYLESSGKTQMREIVLGDGYGSQNSLRQHFGVDQAKQIDRLTIRWPASGSEQIFRNLNVNQILKIVEGEPAWTSIPVGGTSGHSASLRGSEPASSMDKLQETKAMVVK